MKDKMDVVVAGHICLDISPIIETQDNINPSALFTPGSLTNLDGVALSGGGVVANTGFALKKMGAKVLPMTSIGDDEFGHALLHIIEKNIGVGIAPSPDTRTSFSIIIAPKNIDRIIFHDPASNNTFGLDNIDFEAVAGSKLFHFGYPPLMKNMYANGGDALLKTFKAVHDLGVVTSLDMALPDPASESGQIDWQSILAKVLPYVDIFLPSAEEALYIFDREEHARVKEKAGTEDFTSALDMEKICALGERLIALGCAVSGIKCGNKGLYIKTAPKTRFSRITQVLGIKVEDWAGKELFETAYAVKDLKSALGAGDTAIAGFLSAALAGESVYACAKVACMAGALCCTTYDATSAIDGLETILQRVNQNPPKQNTKLVETDFTYDKIRGTWVRA